MLPNANNILTFLKSITGINMSHNFFLVLDITLEKVF